MDFPRQRHALRLQLLPSQEGDPSSPSRRSAAEVLSKSPSLVSRAVASFGVGLKSVASPHLRRCLTEYDQYVGFLPSSVMELPSPTCLYPGEEGGEPDGDALGSGWSSVADPLHGASKLARGGSPLSSFSSALVRRGAETAASSSAFSNIYLSAPEKPTTGDGGPDSVQQNYCTAGGFEEKVSRGEFKEERLSGSTTVGELPGPRGRFVVPPERSSSPTNILRSMSVDCPVSVMGRRRRAEALLRSAVSQAALQDAPATSEEMKTAEAGRALSSLPDSRSACKREQSLPQLSESPLEDPSVEGVLFSSPAKKFSVGAHNSSSACRGSYFGRKGVKEESGEDSPSLPSADRNGEEGVKISSPCGAVAKGRGQGLLLADFHARLEATLHPRRRGGVASMRHLSHLNLQNQSLSASRNASPPRRREEETNGASRGGGRRRGRGRGGGVGKSSQTGAAALATNHVDNLTSQAASSGRLAGDVGTAESSSVFETAVQSALDRQSVDNWGGALWRQRGRDVEGRVDKEVERCIEDESGGERAGAKQASMIRLLSLSVDLGGEEERLTSLESNTSAGEGRKAQTGGESTRGQRTDSDQQEGMGRRCVFSRAAVGADAVEDCGTQESPSDATTGVADCSVGSCSTVSTEVSQSELCVRQKLKATAHELVAKEGEKGLSQGDSAHSLPLLNLEDLSLPLYPASHMTDCVPLTPTSSPLSSSSRFARQVVFSASRSPRVGPLFGPQGRGASLAADRHSLALHLPDAEVGPGVELDEAVEKRSQPRCSAGVQELEASDSKTESRKCGATPTAERENLAANGLLKPPLDPSEEAVLLVRPLVPPPVTPLSSSTRGFACSARLASATAARAIPARCERGADGGSPTGSPMLSASLGGTNFSGSCRCFVPEDSLNFFVEIRSTLLTLLEDLHEACCCCHPAASKESSQCRIPCCAYHFPGDFPSSCSAPSSTGKCEHVCSKRAGLGEPGSSSPGFVESSAMESPEKEGLQSSSANLHGLSSTSLPLRPSPLTTSSSLTSWSSGGRPRHLEPLSADALAAVDSPAAASFVLSAPHVLSGALGGVDRKVLPKPDSGAVCCLDETSRGQKPCPAAGRTESESTDCGGMDCSKLEGDEREGCHKTSLRAQATTTISTTASLLTPACTPTAAAGCSWVSDVPAVLSAGAGALCGAGAGGSLQTPSSPRDFGDERTEVFSSEEQGEGRGVESSPAAKVREGVGEAKAGELAFGAGCAGEKIESAERGRMKICPESGKDDGEAEEELASSVSSGATRCPPGGKNGTGERSTVATPRASPFSSLSMPSSSGSCSLSLYISRSHRDAESYGRLSPARADGPASATLLPPLSSCPNSLQLDSKCGGTQLCSPRYLSCSVSPFADCIQSGGPPGLLPRCGPELHRLFFEHADCIRSSRCFVEQLAYAHIFRLCLEPINGGRPSALSPTHQQFLVRELSLLRQEPSRLLARNAFLWTGQPGCQHIISQCAPFSPASFTSPGMSGPSLARTSYVMGAEGAVSRMTSGSSWRTGGGASCEGGGIGGTSDGRHPGQAVSSDCLWSETGTTCGSGPSRVSTRGQAALAAVLAAGDDSAGACEGRAAGVPESPNAEPNSSADNTGKPLPAAKALLDPSIFLCTADMELGAQKTALVASLRVLRSLAPSWAAQTEGGFAYHLQQVLDVQSLQSKRLQNYRVVLQELFAEPPRAWRHDRLVDVLHDLDCLYSVAKRKQELLQRAQDARQYNAGATFDIRASRLVGKNESPWSLGTNVSHAAAGDAGTGHPASGVLEDEDDPKHPNGVCVGMRGGQRVFSEEQPWLQRGESFHANEGENGLRRGPSAGQRDPEDDEAEPEPLSTRTTLRKRQLQEGEQQDPRKLARSSSADLAQSSHVACSSRAAAASVMGQRSFVGGVRRQRQGTTEEQEGETATDDEGHSVPTGFGSSSAPLAEEDVQTLQQQLAVLESHGLKPSNVGAVLAGIFKTGGKEAALRALQRLLLPASQQALASLRDGGITEQEQQLVLQQLLRDNGGAGEIKIAAEREVKCGGRGGSSTGYSADSARQFKRPAGPGTAGAVSSAVFEDKALDYERFASTRSGGTESLLKGWGEDSVAIVGRKDTGQGDQAGSGFPPLSLPSSDVSQVDTALYGQKRNSVLQFPSSSLQNNLDMPMQQRPHSASLTGSSRFKFRQPGAASPASTSDTAGVRSRPGPSGVRSRSGGISAAGGGGKSGLRNEGRSGGVGSSGHGRGGGGGRDAAAVSSHIEEQAERLEYARRATQLEKVKGVFIGKKNTCWVAQWTDSTGRSRQTCYNIKTLGFEVARQKAIEERYRQMEASAYANGGSHKQQQLTNGSTGGNAPKTSASSELSKEQCAQSLPPSSAMGAGHWPRHRSQEGGSSTLGSAYGVAEDINNGCSSNNLPETSSLQGAAGGSGRGLTAPEVPSENGSTRSAISSPLSNNALVAAVVEATASVLGSAAHAPHRSSSFSSSSLAADLLAQFKSVSNSTAPGMTTSLHRSLGGPGSSAATVSNNRPALPASAGAASAVSPSAALPTTATGMHLGGGDDPSHLPGSRTAYSCLLTGSGAEGTDTLEEAALQAASSPSICRRSVPPYQEVGTTPHLDPGTATDPGASQSSPGAVLAALLGNSVEAEGTSGASNGTHSSSVEDSLAKGTSTAACPETCVKSPSLAYLSAALVQAFPALGGASNAAPGSPGGTDRCTGGSATSAAAPVPSHLMQQLVQQVLQSPSMHRSPQESPKQADGRRSGSVSSSSSAFSASKSETDIDDLVKTLGGHGLTPELLEALQQLGGANKELLSGIDSLPSTCASASGLQAKNGKGKSSSTFSGSPHTPGRRPGSPLSLHEDMDTVPKGSAHSASASPHLASPVGRDSSDTVDQLALLLGSSGFCPDAPCTDAYGVDFASASSIMNRKHRMAYTHKQGRRTYASQARDFPRVEGIKYNVKCACWEVTSRAGFKVFSTRRLGGLQEAYNLAVKWKQEADGGLYRGSDDEMPHSLTPDQQRALILLSQGSSLSPGTDEDEEVEDEDDESAADKQPSSQESDSSKGETHEGEGADVTIASGFRMQQPGQAEWRKGRRSPSWSQLEAGILSALQANTGNQRAGLWSAEPFEAPAVSGSSGDSHGVSEADILGSLLEQLAKSSGETRNGTDVGKPSSDTPSLHVSSAGAGRTGFQNRTASGKLEESTETDATSSPGGGETVTMLSFDTAGESRGAPADGECCKERKAYPIASNLAEKKRRSLECDGPAGPIRRLGSQDGSSEGMAKKAKTLS